jgi:hypothetical protein
MEATELKFLNLIHHLPQLSSLENYFYHALNFNKKQKMPVKLT